VLYINVNIIRSVRSVKKMHQVLPICSKVFRSMISDITDKFLSNYSNSFFGPLFVLALCIYT